MRKMLLGALAALAITTANAAEEEYKNSANYWLPYCKMTFKEAGATNTNSLGHGYCMGTLHGMTQMLAYAQELKQVDPALCTTMPRSATPNQLLNVVIKFADAHPEVTHMPFITLAFVAIREAWPCK
jgi:hypothetical protein